MNMQALWKDLRILLSYQMRKTEKLISYFEISQNFFFLNLTRNEIS